MVLQATFHWEIGMTPQSASLNTHIPGIAGMLRSQLQGLIDGAGCVQGDRVTR